MVRCRKRSLSYVFTFGLNYGHDMDRVRALQLVLTGRTARKKSSLLCSDYLETFIAHDVRTDCLLDWH